MIKSKPNKKVAKRRNPKSKEVLEKKLESLLGKKVHVHSKYSHIYGRLNLDEEWESLYRIELENAGTYFRIDDVKDIQDHTDPKIYLIDIVDKW